MMLYEFVCVCILLAVGIAAVVLICLGLATDLTSGNLSLEIKVENVDRHTQPTYTFCPVGANENTLPGVVYCSLRLNYPSKKMPMLNANGATRRSTASLTCRRKTLTFGASIRSTQHAGFWAPMMTTSSSHRAARRTCISCSMPRVSACACGIALTWRCQKTLRTGMFETSFLYLTMYLSCLFFCFFFWFVVFR